MKIFTSNNFIPYDLDNIRTSLNKLSQNQQEPNQETSLTDISSALQNKFDRIKEIVIQQIVNDQDTINYLMNPFPNKRIQLSQKFTANAIITVLNESTPPTNQQTAQFVSQLTGQQNNVTDTTISQLNQIPGVADIFQNIDNYLKENLIVGCIPDEIANQSQKLKQLDLTDTGLNPIFTTRIKLIEQQNPLLARQLFMIIQQLQGRDDLLGAEKQLIGA